MTRSLRVVVVDDHPTFRTGLRDVLEAAGIEVVAAAADGREAVQVIKGHDELDVVVMDLLMPGMGGVSATREVLLTRPGLAVLVLTMSGADDTVAAALAAGARGYLLKDASAEEIVSAVRAVAAGQAVFGAAVADAVLRQFSPRRAPLPFPTLSARESEVLELIAQGRDNTAIARILVIAPKTVRNHVSSVFSKLGVADRAQAVIVARDAGLGRGPR